MIKQSRLFFLILVLAGVAVLTIATIHSNTSQRQPARVIDPATPKKTALLAGGCFWCTEADFEKLPGVLTVVSAYAGGTTPNPTYQDYAAGGYREVVEVMYNPTQVTYAQLVEYVIKHSDPTDADGSFYDRGKQYAPAIYYENDSELAGAQQVVRHLNELNAYSLPINIAIIHRVKFYPAEEYHQDYYRKNPLRYQYYRHASGRDAFIQKHWGNNTGVSPLNVTSWQSFQKPSAKELRAKLTPLVYSVTQEEGTEPAFKNEFNDNKREGIYVDVVSGEPLYSSKDKFDSGTGWPSFVQPITPESVVLKSEGQFFWSRTEVRSRFADSHLGHVFDDGPIARGGKRYCMNSAALRFIPKENMKEQGYDAYLNSVE